MKQQKLFDGIDTRVQIVIKKQNPRINYSIIPKDYKTQIKLANEMILFVKEDEKIDDLDLFPLSKNYSPYRFYKIAHTNPEFEEALEVAQYFISTRIKKGWKTRSIDPGYAKEMLPEYNKAYKTWVNTKVTMAIEARFQQIQGPTTINLIKEVTPLTLEVTEWIANANRLRDPTKTK